MVQSRVVFRTLLIAITVVLLTGPFAPAKPTAAIGNCFTILGIGSPAGNEGKYIGIQDAYAFAADQIMMAMFKTDPNNRYFTNKGMYWVEGRSAFSQNFREIPRTRQSYNGTSGSALAQLRSTFPMGYAPKGSLVYLRFGLNSENDWGKPKYTNSIKVSNNCP